MNKSEVRFLQEKARPDEYIRGVINTLRKGDADLRLYITTV
jgi:hypothetical protein